MQGHGSHQRADRGHSIRSDRCPGRMGRVVSIQGLILRDVAEAPNPEESEIGRIFREEYGRSVASLIRVFGDIDLAEDAVQEAFTVALRKWPDDGFPPNPGGWITTTARKRAIDRLRRESRERELLGSLWTESFTEQAPPD